MPKPSIFSRDYDEKMKKRKRRRIVIFISLLVVALVVLFNASISNMLGKKTKSGFANIKEKITSISNIKFFSKAKDEDKENKNSNVKEDISKNNQDAKSNQIKNNANQKPIKKEVPKTGSYSIKLSNEEEIKLIYSIVNNEKQYTQVLPKGISYDISPSKKNVVIIENKTQNMILIDINGTQKDITKKEYISSKGDIFKKDYILKQSASYIWCASPKYLNEDNIIYVSQLPWFNKVNQRYLWKYSISNNQYYHNLSPNGGELSGVDIKYGANTSHGLEVLVDGVKNIIK
ncbi:hypothetical protein GOM49_03195 [Clostridium bovifaecis]|uniref:tRNA (Guanine-N1)-methyltransferase n=1 Tax=Clostridium bovifaecis TaxID=2184719 RepID=A0A6I6EQA2_9CLOT|nr:hypothetical protein GOM49_03195 [Clostridium bovifaecis]